MRTRIFSSHIPLHVDQLMSGWQFYIHANHIFLIIKCAVLILSKNIKRRKGSDRSHYEVFPLTNILALPTHRDRIQILKLNGLFTGGLCRTSWLSYTIKNASSRGGGTSPQIPTASGSGSRRLPYPSIGNSNLFLTARPRAIGWGAIPEKKIPYPSNRYEFFDLCSTPRKHRL